MLEVIFAGNRERYLEELSSMHRLRHTVFVERLGWELNTVNGMEFDQYDTDDAYYLVHRDDNGNINACTRLIQTTKPYMLKDIFPNLISNGTLKGNQPPTSPATWEVTRFAADAETTPRNIAGVLVAGMIEFGLFMGAKKCISVTNVALEPILKRAGWNPERLGEPVVLGGDCLAPIAAHMYDVNPIMLNNVKQKGRLFGNVIKNLDDLQISIEREVA